MEWGFDVDDVLQDEITPFRQEEINKINYSMPRRYHSAYSRRTQVDLTKHEKLRTILDDLGQKSAKAQSLGSPITSFGQMTTGDHQTVYVLRDAKSSSAVLGFIKVGYKPLFIMDKNGNQFETRPICVLDFYVMENYQRKGCGRRLFEFMLQDLTLHPAQLAIDRPSGKFTAFLRKHYNLVSTVPQVNNFVIFDGFFRYNKPVSRRNRLTDDFRERRKYEPPRTNSWRRDPTTFRKQESSKPKSLPSTVRREESSNPKSFPSLHRSGTQMMLDPPLAPREPKKMSQLIQRAHWPPPRVRKGGLQRQNTSFNLFGIPSKHF